MSWKNANFKDKVSNQQQNTLYSSTQLSGRSRAKIVEQRAIKNRVQYIHCR
jgi:hypothetical protein